MSAQTILHRLHDNGRKTPNNPALYEKENGVWKAMTWAAYVKNVRQAAGAMIALGLGKGDIVTILGFNRSEWVIADLGIMLAGGAAAGIYTSNSPGEVQYIAHHCESKMIVVEDEGQYNKVREEIANLPDLKYIVLMRRAKMPTDDPMAIRWDDFMAKGNDV
ncbi:MAG TPA: long-chain fatty acid--CoA ligase, partial [Anaerolineae bacterium]|nr:long-chain fatty acid--CoA ligase [Anaerolineae bacterium]